MIADEQYCIVPRHHILYAGIPALNKSYEIKYENNLRSAVAVFKGSKSECIEFVADTTINIPDACQQCCDKQEIIDNLLRVFIFFIIKKENESLKQANERLKNQKKKEKSFSFKVKSFDNFIKYANDLQKKASEIDNNSNEIILSQNYYIFVPKELFEELEQTNSAGMITGILIRHFFKKEELSQHNRDSLQDMYPDKVNSIFDYISSRKMKTNAAVKQITNMCHIARKNTNNDL